MNSPVISVLMPVYNADRYVAQAVESILRQTFTDFEFLIVDDGSRDRSLTILQHYAAKDCRIHLTSRPNTGYVVALNEMLAKATGKYIARMDADDIALPERFAKQVAFLEHNPEFVCVGGGYQVIDKRNRLLLHHLSMPEQDEENQRLSLMGHTTICHPCAMFRRAAIETVGYYEPDLMPTEDLDLWLRLGEVGKLANLNEPILQYRFHSGSVSERKQALQRQKAKECCERAWKRRGIEGTFTASALWRPSDDRHSRHQFMLQYGWWAFNSGQRQTAMIYGLKAIQALPFKEEGWKLLICALLKSPKSRET